MSRVDERFTVGAGAAGAALGAFLRDAVPGSAWSAVKRWIASGKVFVDGQPVTSAGARLRPGQQVELRMAAPRPQGDRPRIELVHQDAQVVVLDKPSGVSSVPYEKREGGTAMDLVREAWRRQGRRATDTPLLVVHRIDKATSGLLMFARTKRAERELGLQFRRHTIDRTYLCAVHGDPGDRRIESRLVADRGDRLRGSTRFPDQGKRAVTHVRVLRALGSEASLCEVTLETGRTHQIRIHLAEAGHPLIGEPVYIRDWLAAGCEPLPAPRLLLHAATLGFAHPGDGRRLAFESSPPDDFQQALARLSRR
jgi:23S rRNA pseudouridine1911/1915/1917 synthase